MPLVELPQALLHLHGVLVAGTAPYVNRDGMLHHLQAMGHPPNPSSLAGVDAVFCKYYPVTPQTFMPWLALMHLLWYYPVTHHSFIHSFTFKVVALIVVLSCHPPIAHALIGLDAASSRHCHQGKALQEAVQWQQNKFAVSSLTANNPCMCNS